MLTLQTKKDYTMAGLLCLLAFLVRFSLIAKGPFHMDALELARNAAWTMQTLTIHYQHGPGYPLTVLCAAVFVFVMKLFGCHDPVYGVNMMSVVFGSLSIAAYYLFARKILDAHGSFWSALAFSFLPLHLSLSTFGGTQPIFLFLSLLAMRYLYSALEHDQGTNYLWLSAFLFGCALAVRIQEVFMMCSFIYLYIAWHAQKRFLSFGCVIRRLFFFLGIISVTAFIFYVPMVKRGELAQMHGFLSPYYMRHSWEYFRYMGTFFVDILGFPMLVLIIIGMLCFFTEQNKLIFYSLVLWFLSLFLYYGSFSCVEARYFLLMLPPAMLMFGYCVSKIFRYWKMATVILVALIIIPSAVSFYGVAKFRHDYNLCQDFGNFLHQNTEPNAVIIAMDMGMCIEYYGNRTVFYKAIGKDKKQFDTCFDHIDSMLAKHFPLYIISSGIYSYDPLFLFENGLKKHYALTSIGSRSIEDWHRNTLRQDIYMEKLYKISKKSPEKV